MNGSLTFSTVMDIAVLGLLAATVFLGFRLSSALRNFRESRQDMEGLLNRLIGNISAAENAIANLQNASRTSGVQLQEIVNESKFLADELRFMNEAGNNLADRLEKLAEKNRILIAQMEAAGTGVPVQEASHRRTPQTVVDWEEEDEAYGFDASLTDNGEAFPDFMMEEEPDLQSQAEREFFAALSRNRNRQAGRG